MKKRLLALLCFLVLCLGMLPSSALASESGSYVALGDSISAGYGLGEGELSFPEMLERDTEYELIDFSSNDGVTSQDLLETLTKTEVIAAVQDADVITITVGGNDLMNALYEYLAKASGTMTADEIREGLENGTIKDPPTLLALMSSLSGFPDSSHAEDALKALGTNLSSALEQIKALNPDVTCIIANQYNPYGHINNQFAADIVSTFKVGVQALNTALAGVAQDQGVIVVDVYEAFAASSANPCNAYFTRLDDFSLDFHPNALGHQLIAEAVEQALPEPDPAQTYDVWVVGTQVSDDNAGDVLGDGTVSYDPTSNTLTLNNANLTNTPESPQYPLQTTEPDLTIKLVGENTVSSSAENVPAVHIAPSQGETKIVGDGAGAKLTVTSDISEGIRVDWSDLAVQDCTVFIRTDVWGGLIVSGGVLAIRNAQVDVASSPDSDVAQAVYVLEGRKGISITNSTVTVSNGARKANVIYSDAGISIDGSTVTVTGTADDAYPAVYAAGDIDVKNGSEVTAKSAGMRGIFTEADMTVTDSTVTATGTTDEGMIVVGALTLSEGANVTARTESDNGATLALVTKNLSIDGSELTAHGGLDLFNWYDPDDTLRSLSIVPASGGLMEFKVDRQNRDGSAAVHFREEGANSPYDVRAELTDAQINWLGAYRYVHIGKHVHEGGAATCARPAVCDDCGREYGVVDSDAHSFTRYASNNDATCTKDGTETATCDNGCGETDTRAVQGSALGHDPELVDAKPATCEDDGYTGDEVCKRCHELLKQGAAIPALGHDYVDGACTVCGEKDPDYVAPGRPTGPVGPGEPEAPEIPDASEIYDDVDPGAWYLGPVSWAAHEGVMTGYADGTFGPDDALSRSQMATVLWRLAGEPGADPSALEGCPDLDAGAFYAGAVAWALEAGVFSGYADGSFGPGDAITREQAACVLMSDAARRGGDTSARADLSGYPDAGRVSAFASEAVSWAVAEGVISGKNPEQGVYLLEPQAPCSRAELCALLQRLMEE